MNVYILGLMFGVTTVVVGSGGLTTCIGKHIVTATSSVSSTGCPHCPFSWPLGVGWSLEALVYLNGRSIRY